MIEVGAFEGRVLVTARAVVGAIPWERALETLAAPCPRLTRMSPEALHLLDRTMAIGLPLTLARRGAWQRDRFLGDDGVPEPAARRGWERSPPPLELSRATSTWILALARGTPAWTGAEPPRTAGDELVLYLLCDALAPLARHVTETPWVPQLCALGTLAWLGHSDVLAGTRLSPPDDPARWAAWMAPPAARIAEALQPDLARRWVAIERAKRDVADPSQMVALGTAQEAVLGAWFDACERSGRRDLARFATNAAARLVARPVPAHAWAASLPAQATLASRQAARISAGAFLRALERPARWDREHRARRHFDDGYAAAQLLLRDFEALGPARLAHARSALAELERPPTAHAQAYTIGMENEP